MLRVYNPDDTFRLEEVFSGNVKLQELVLNWFTSIVPLMLLSKPALMQIDGIGERYAQAIHEKMVSLGYEPARPDEKLSAVINRHFGCIEDAPISTLYVGCEPNRQGIYRPVYRRDLDALDAVRSVFPHHRVMDLVQYTKSQFIDVLILQDLGLSIGEIEHYVADIDDRLSLHGLRFAFQ